MARRSSLPRPLILPIVIVLFLHVMPPIRASESDVLLKFKDSLLDNGALSSWNPSTQSCNGDDTKWEGVLCDNGTVWGLKLENMGIRGVIDAEALKQLPNLRTLSFMNNSLDGGMPNIKTLGSLKTVYLSNNKFSGVIPEDAFAGMNSLKKIHLARNAFSGEIPNSLTGLPKLIEAMLEENKFDGVIPEFQQERLMTVNLSYNALVGQIPRSLSMMDSSVFAGNPGLCGDPLPSCSVSGKPSIVTTVVVIIVVVCALAALISVFFILSKRKNSPKPELTAAPSRSHIKTHSNDMDKVELGSPHPQPPSAPAPASVDSKKSEQSVKLTFLQDDRGRFDLPDLLRASAEVLGGGVFGSTYKAALTTGAMMVVKRFRHMNNVGREEFHEHMRRLGKLRNKNLLPIVAYYYRKEEKLLVSDYVDNFSLAVQLHGRSRSRVHGGPLDWPTRLKIIRGITRGLLYLYKELPSLIAPHGHLKSSNVLLSKSFEPLLEDYALVPIVNPEQAQHLMIAYKSPEYKQHRRITKKTDVWSLGMLILETLTGKFPENHLQQGQGSESDLATLVQSLVKDEWTMEVFDKDMGGTTNSQGEMIKLLKIGLWCCESDVDKRLDIKEAVEKIEMVRERDGSADASDDFYSSYTSEDSTQSSKGLSNDYTVTIL